AFVSGGGVEEQRGGFSESRNERGGQARKAGGRVEIRADLSTPVQRLEVDPAGRRWVYASPHFEFICDDDLGLAVVREFVWMFESVWQFCGSYPYDLPRLRAKEQVRMKTYLVRDKADYVRMGGPPNSAGVYIPSRDVILIPFESLGIRGSNGSYNMDRSTTNFVLRHEIAHQLMKGETQQAAWFIEGSAEFAATVPFEVSRMLLTHHQNAVISYLTANGWKEQGGRKLGRLIVMQKLEGFMSDSYAGFQGTNNSYASALLLYYYFAQFEGDRKGTRLGKYVRQLQKGLPEQDARRELLGGKGYEQLERDVASAWNQVGIRLKFQ
ncbi:MAG: hypothetical protein AAGC74_14315, partial [Verrucomicrobiota bacterium]